MRTLAALSLLAAFPHVGVQGQTVQDKAGVLRVDVHVVLVDAQVLNKKTRQAARELKKEDFELYEDKVRQQVSSFSQDTLPLSVVLLFDLTDSVRPVLKFVGRRSAGSIAPPEAGRRSHSDGLRGIGASPARGHHGRALAVAAIEKASRMESGEAAFFNEGIFQAAEQLARGKNIPAGE